MSTGGTRQYLCNRCGHAVTSTPHPGTSTLICPHCSTSSFLELIQNPNPNPTDNSVNSDQLEITDVISGVGLSATGGLVEFYVLPASRRDYYIRSLPSSIQYVANRNGRATAARAVVEALPSVNISEEMVRSGVSQCVICKESFRVGDVAKELPCKHVYHCDCVLPWLGFHNSCPICRFELPTDDAEYENMRRGASSAEGSNARDGNSGRGNGNGAGGSNEDID